MRKRNVMIGLAGALALSVGVAGSAQAAGTLSGQTLEVTASAGKLDKKVAGAVNSLTVVVNTQYSGSTPPFTGKVINTKVDFPKDFVFTPPSAQCDPNSPGFNASTTEAAKSACGPAQVGSGSANLAGAVAGVTAVVTAFNGTTQGGNPTILLHSRTTARHHHGPHRGPGERSRWHVRQAAERHRADPAARFRDHPFLDHDPEAADGARPTRRRASRPSSTSARSAPRRSGPSRPARPLTRARP